MDHCLEHMVHRSIICPHLRVIIIGNHNPVPTPMHIVVFHVITATPNQLEGSDSQHHQALDIEILAKVQAINLPIMDIIIISIKCSSPVLE